MKEGIYFGMRAEEYHAAPGLSHSGMRELAVSPLDYWSRYVDPARGEAPPPTPAQRLGTAIHCRLLEPGVWQARYGRKLRKADYPGALVTVEDLKGWLANQGLSTGHKRKQDLIDRVNQAAADGAGVAVVWDSIAEQHARDNAGKELLDADDWDRVEAVASAALAEPLIRGLMGDLGDGAAEASIFVVDPETGVLLKARLDLMRPRLTVDLKSFGNSRRKPRYKAIKDACWHEEYYSQGVFYHDLRELARAKLAAGELAAYELSGRGRHLNVIDSLANGAGHAFAFVFVESQRPYGLGVVPLSDDTPEARSPETYWAVARDAHRRHKQTYRECVARYGLGERPWREPVRPSVLLDEDMPGLMFTGQARLLLDDQGEEEYQAAQPIPEAELEPSLL